MNEASPDCCSSTVKTQPKKLPCPSHGGACGEVALTTLIQHIKTPWELEDKERRYFFCDDAACDVVYFAEDGWQAGQGDVRTLVGQKDTTDAATLCYCFGVTRGEVLADPTLKDYVIRQTKAKTCACSTQNPSGLCCLKNFPK
ncbi:MAG: hypothetical protein COB59_11180 [Rhodospirillaceae bacterium]|nr:MAG: hypothetical protein COB59_11180 [Rhodospirillaceae bacterium]